MIENKKITDVLIIITIVMIIIEFILIVCFYDNSIIQDIVTFIGGIVASLIMSIVISCLTYKYKKEEIEENLINSLIKVYSKMIKFKCNFKSTKDKNKMIVDLNKEINEYLSIIHDIEYDLVYKIRNRDLKKTIVLYKYNDKAVNELGKLKFNNEKIVIEAKGLNTQKDFINSYNNMLNKIREYLEICMIKKYEEEYKILKRLDYKYEDLYTESNEIIEYD